jgi:hypothetical protein
MVWSRGPLRLSTPSPGLRPDADASAAPHVIVLIERRISAIVDALRDY